MKEPASLSPELEALLAPHRRVLLLPPSVEARAIARAAAVVAAPEPVAIRGSMRARWVFAVITCAAAGAGAGAYAARAWSGRGAPISAAPVPIAMQPRPPGSATTQPDREPPATILVPAPRVSRRGAGKASATAVAPTNAELHLLRAAREALTRADFAGALAAVTDHARRFRNGSLVEEREALRVESLSGLGRLDDAQRAAVQFHARFPHSVLRPTIERMTGADR